MFKHLAIAAILAASATMAVAADAPSTRFYAGADIGTTKFEGESHRETSYGAFGGYQFCPQIAIEGAYRRLFTENFDGGSAHLDQLSISAVGTIPLSNGFSVFGRLGANRIAITANAGGDNFNEHANRGLYGIGMGYDFTPAISARIEIQKPMSDLTNFNAGVVFKF
jgi:predicted porin